MKKFTFNYMKKVSFNYMKKAIYKKIPMDC